MLRKRGAAPRVPRRGDQLAQAHGRLRLWLDAPGTPLAYRTLPIPLLTLRASIFAAFNHRVACGCVRATIGTLGSLWHLPEHSIIPSRFRISLSVIRLIGHSANFARNATGRGEAMGKPTKAGYSLTAAGGTDQAPSALPDSLLPAYRAAVEDLVEEASGHPRPSDLPIVERLVAKRLGQPEFTAVLSYLDGGAEGAVGRLSHEIRAYELGTRSSASDLPTFIRILLLSQIDSAWCSETIPFNSDTDVLDSAELLDLNPLRSAKVLEFKYRAQPAGYPAGPGTGRSTRRCRQSVRVWPGCASRVRGPLSWRWSIKSRANSPPRHHRELPAPG